jgi:hypothetical protein
MPLANAVPEHCVLLFSIFLLKLKGDKNGGIDIMIAEWSMRAKVIKS